MFVQSVSRAINYRLWNGDKTLILGNTKWNIMEVENGFAKCEIETCSHDVQCTFFCCYRQQNCKRGIIVSPKYNGNLVINHWSMNVIQSLFTRFNVNQQYLWHRIVFYLVLNLVIKSSLIAKCYWVTPEEPQFPSLRLLFRLKYQFRNLTSMQ